MAQYDSILSFQMHAQTTEKQWVLNITNQETTRCIFIWDEKFVDILIGWMKNIQFSEPRRTNIEAGFSLIGSELC